MKSSKLNLFLAASTLERLRSCEHKNSVALYSGDGYWELCNDCGSTREHRLGGEDSAWLPPNIWGR